MTGKEGAAARAGPSTPRHAWGSEHVVCAGNPCGGEGSLTAVAETSDPPLGRLAVGLRRKEPSWLPAK